MKILAFSDWRVQSFEVLLEFIDDLRLEGNHLDLIVYAGDDINRFKEGKIDYFKKLARKTKLKKVLAIRGNDDLGKDKEILKSEWVHNLHLKPFKIKGLNFMGVEGAVGDIGFTLYSEEQVEKKLKSQHDKNKINILVSHVPPRDVLDSAIRFSEDGLPRNIGSESVRKFLEDKDNNCIINVCGHCHLCGGRDEFLNNALVLNVASHDSKGSVGKLCLINYEAKKNKVYYDWYNSDGLNLNSLRNVYGLGYSYEHKLRDFGIMDVPKLIESDYDLEIGIPKATFEKLKVYARAYTNNESVVLDKTKILEVKGRKSIIFDIETDLLCEKVWMIGILVEGKFIQLYADNFSKEKSILQEFANILDKYHEKEYCLLSYSGTNFDFRVTKNALIRKKIDSKRIERFEHIDVCNLVKRSYISHIQTYALKDFAGHIGYPFKHGDMNGLLVALEYMEHLKKKKELPRKIFDYNQDDVYAIPFILEKLSN